MLCQRFVEEIKCFLNLRIKQERSHLVIYVKYIFCFQYSFITKVRTGIRRVPLRY